MENMALIGLSRQVTLERQLAVVANNLANVNTTGFKSDKSLFQEYLSSSARDDDFSGRDRTVSFVQDRATFHDFSAGPMEQTKNPLDVAIKGEAFLAVQTPAGERYTRDGSLQINGQGQLVTASGAPVLGTSGPIVLQPGDNNITIGGDGTVTVQEGANHIDAIRGKLRVVSFPQAQKMLKEGSNLYAAGEGGAPIQATVTSAKVVQGFLEKSNVSSVLEMTQMIDVTRAYAQISSMLQQQTDMRKSAIEKLADVPT